MNWNRRLRSGVIGLLSLAATQEVPAQPQESSNQPGLMKLEFIYETAPFPECHASTIAETKTGLVAAWFGGTRERHPDVGIWSSRQVGGTWSAPVEVANGVESASVRYPCWNPVLFQPKKGPLLLFYKVGPTPSRWWGMLTSSDDAGKTWDKPRRLPDAILGPIKNKPIQLANGDILCGSSTENDGWRVHFERTSDLGKTWQATPSLEPAKEVSAIQPTLLSHGDNKLQALVRTHQQHIFETWSEDNGKTWSNLTATDLPNPNSGIDAVTLRDGRQLLVYNHTAKGRSPINVALSADGKQWQAALVLEEEAQKEFSYPAVIQSEDGLVHITYTWKRQRIRHAVVEPGKLRLRQIVSGDWPK